MISKTAVTIFKNLASYTKSSTKKAVARFHFQENSFCQVKTNLALKMVLIINCKILKRFTRNVSSILIRARKNDLAGIEFGKVRFDRLKQTQR